jgi:hypothetical protein
MSEVFYDTPYGPGYVEFCFTRHGDCPQCEGRGHISRYRHIDGGRCHRCNGSGGHWPPEGTYEIYRRAQHHEIKDGADSRDLYLLGEVTKTKQGWQTSRGTYPTRNAAALALYLSKEH